MTLIHRSTPLEAEKKTTYLSLARKVQDKYDAPIILARVGQKLVELNKEVGDDAASRGPVELTFITTKERDGHKTYERGATMLFLRAVNRVLGKKIGKLKLEYAI